MHIDLDTDDVLFREGDPPGDLYVVTKGQLSVIRNGARLASLGPSDFVGELSLLLGEPRTATIVAEEPSTLMVYDAEAFGQLVSSRPNIALRIIRLLAERLRATNELVSASSKEEE